MSDLVCEHGSLRRKCEFCERDERIAELESALAEAREALSRCIGVIDELDIQLTNHFGPGQFPRYIMDTVSQARALIGYAARAAAKEKR